MPDRCAEHAWASIGVTVADGAVTRVWSCENCPAWSRQALGDDAEVDWAETWLSGR